VPSGGAATSGGGGGAAAAPAEETKEEKVEEKVGCLMMDLYQRTDCLAPQEESDDDMGFGLFD